MSIYTLKSQFQSLLRPISNQLVKQGFTANQVTISAVFLTGATAYVLVNSAKSSHQNNQKIWFVLPISLFIRMGLNAIDGMMAREHGQASQIGALLNETGDMLSDTLILSALYPYLDKTYLPNQQLVLHNHVIITLSLVTEVPAIKSQLLVSERANQGPLGKSDRAFELGVIGAIVGSGLFSKTSLNYLKYLYLINELLLIKTITNRIQFIAKKMWEEQYQQDAKNLAYSNKRKKTMTLEKHNSNLANPKNTQKNISEHIGSYNGYDGTAMFYRYWLDKPLDAIKKNISNEKIVIMLHRGHEHSARLTQMAHAFVHQGYQVFAWDARGNGRSGGERDHADSFAQLVRDFDQFVNLVKSLTHAVTEQMLIIASSLGAVIASSWVHDYAPTIRGMILGTPAFSIRLYVPFAKPALKFAKKIGVMNRVSSYVKAKVLTHDIKAQQIYNDDPLISSSISRDLLIDSLETGKRLVDDAGAFTTPTFIMCAGKDYVVDKKVIREFYEQIRSPIKRWALYPDSYHAIFHELNKEQVFADCIEFGNQVFAEVCNPIDLTDAHKPTNHADSYSKDRVDRMAVNGVSPGHAVTKYAIKKFGHISDAISTGLQHGFDSGSSLQKVYNFAPKGVNPLGRYIDKFYLNNIGWQGIRIRKDNLVELANLAIQELHKENSPIKVLDIASGHGQYIIELLDKHPLLQVQMRDYDSNNIEAIISKGEKLGLSDRIEALQNDAFDDASYSNEKMFNVAIVSGMFELFSDNTLVSTAILGMHKQLKDGGYLIYTNQPWHPEQEFIGKTLNSHQGKDWVMRCRSQAEMDQLVKKAGFEKVGMRIDDFGIFTVSLAKKK